MSLCAHDPCILFYCWMEFPPSIYKIISLIISHKMEAAKVEDEVLQLWFCKCLVQFQCPPNNRGNVSCLSVLLIFVNIMYPFSN